MNKAIFLDRDGTINVDTGYVCKKEDFEFIDGAIEGLRLLQDKGYMLIIITNQSGIGRGYFSEQEYLEFQSWINEQLANKGIMITETYYCPHVEEDGCDCRKPRVAMFEEAAKQYNIKWGDSCAIGDKMRDLTICTKKRMKGFLISKERKCNDLPQEIEVVVSLYEAATQIIKDEIGEVRK